MPYTPKIRIQGTQVIVLVHIRLCRVILSFPIHFNNSVSHYVQGMFFFCVMFLQTRYPISEEKERTGNVILLSRSDYQCILFQLERNLHTKSDECPNKLILANVFSVFQDGNNFQREIFPIITTQNLSMTIMRYFLRSSVMCWIHNNSDILNKKQKSDTFSN